MVGVNSPRLRGLQKKEKNPVIPNFVVAREGLGRFKAWGRKKKSKQGTIAKKREHVKKKKEPFKAEETREGSFS